MFPEIVVLPSTNPVTNYHQERFRCTPFRGPFRFFLIYPLYKQYKDGMQIAFQSVYTLRMRLHVGSCFKRTNVCMMLHAYACCFVPFNWELWLQLCIFSDRGLLWHILCLSSLSSALRGWFRSPLRCCS